MRQAAEKYQLLRLLFSTSQYRNFRLTTCIRYTGQISMQVFVACRSVDPTPDLCLRGWKYHCNLCQSMSIFALEEDTVKILSVLEKRCELL